MEATSLRSSLLLIVVGRAGPSTVFGERLRGSMLEFLVAKADAWNTLSRMKMLSRE